MVDEGRELVLQFLDTHGVPIRGNIGETPSRRSLACEPAQSPNRDALAEAWCMWTRPGSA